MIPTLVNKVKELYDFDDDKAIAMLRHFNWNEQKLQDKWLNMDEREQSQLLIDIGIDFD